MKGASIIGGHSRKNPRVDNDYYATDPEAVFRLLEECPIFGMSFLEPCVGGGHIARAVLEYFDGLIDMTALDIVDRGYPGTIIQDFLTWETDSRFDIIITNPPYSLASEFVEKCMMLLSKGGCLAMFLKIQFLEGQKREALFRKYPPKYIYVFRNRMATWSNGRCVDPDTGKRWATTFCNAWFVWEKGNRDEPIVRWL